MCSVYGCSYIAGVDKAFLGITIDKSRVIQSRIQLRLYCNNIRLKHTRRHRI